MDPAVHEIDEEPPVLERADEVIERLTQRWGDIALEEEEEIGFEPVGESVGVVTERRNGDGCVLVTEIQPGLFMFIFYDETDMRRVLDEGPWSFDNSTLVCRQVELGTRPTTVELNSVDMWVQLYDLPLGYTSEAVLEQAANFIGSFVKVDDRYPGAPWKMFHRVRVSIPVDKPLKRRMKLIKRDKTSCWVNFRYERLHNFCFYCGLLGHAYKFCKLARKSGLTADKFPYTADLKVGGGSRGPRQVGDPWLVPLDGKGKSVKRGEGKMGDTALGDGAGGGGVRVGEERASEGVVVAASKRRRGDGVHGGSIRMDAGDVVMSEFSKNGFTAGPGGQARPSQ
ncbi:PREDICTED: uncharacterized protein LOC109150415 [Ipomoea nil]|uniref:uncharacterized protein LOC109150415 n=1 Tax=Ipomoea nil TaxID=35883 RepID=UPI000900E0F3|nr:PREDICTED: uncharacterized protein LOC109150415 [Ipomoea nil]